VKRIRFTQLAEADLDEIGDYLAADNPDRAVSTVLRLQQACRELAGYPLRYPLLRGMEHRQFRQRLLGPYRIVYRDGDPVVIARILHGARDYERLLDPDR
jgi:toxin ParE1/3/4